MACSRDVGTGEAQEPVPLPIPQYFEQLVPVPLQLFQWTSGPTKCVPLQYLKPSYAPAVRTGAKEAVWLGIKWLLSP